MGDEFRKKDGLSKGIRRRDLLKVPVGLVGAYALLKLGVRGVVGPAPPPGGDIVASLEHLSPRQARIVTAAALAMVGPSAEAAFLSGRWKPAQDFDRLLSGMAPDQRAVVGIGLQLFEEWTWGMKGFSGSTREVQLAQLAKWRSSGLAIQRSIWGVLHAATCSSFSGTEAGWEVMGYPGPCLAQATRPGRPPGQSAVFEWDERVP